MNNCLFEIIFIFIIWIFIFLSISISMFPIILITKYPMISIFMTIYNQLSIKCQFRANFLSIFMCLNGLLLMNNNIYIEIIIYDQLSIKIPIYNQFITNLKSTFYFCLIKHSICCGITTIKIIIITRLFLF